MEEDFLHHNGGSPFLVKDEDLASTDSKEPTVSKNLTVLDLFGGDSDNDETDELTIATKDAFGFVCRSGDTANVDTQSSASDNTKPVTGEMAKLPVPKIVYFWEREGYQPEPEREEVVVEEMKEVEEPISPPDTYEPVSSLPKINGEVKSKTHSAHHHQHHHQQHQHHHHHISKHREDKSNTRDPRKTTKTDGPEELPKSADAPLAAKKAKKEPPSAHKKSVHHHQHAKKSAALSSAAGKLLRKGQNSGTEKLGEAPKEGLEQEKRGVADLVVKYLTPHYKAGRFANKELFKSVARAMSHHVMETIKGLPTSGNCKEEVKRLVKEFMEENKTIQSHQVLKGWR